MGKCYVVLHSIIAGEWMRGQVVPEAKLGDTVQRFLDLGAIREATEVEAKLDKVDLEAKRPNASAQQLLAEKDQTIALLRARVSELSAQVDALTAPPAAVPEATAPSEDASPSKKGKK